MSCNDFHMLDLKWLGLEVPQSFEDRKSDGGSKDTGMNNRNWSSRTFV